MGRYRHLIANGCAIRGGDTYWLALCQEGSCLGVLLQGLSLADGRDAINSQSVRCVWVKLCLQCLQVFLSEMPLQDLKALGVSKACRQVAGISQRNQVFAAVALVVVKYHRRLPGGAVQQDP